MSNKEKLKHYFKDIELNKEITGTTSWFFLLSISLTIILFILNIVALYASPDQLSGFESGDQVFLGFFDFDVNSSKLSLNWCSYLVGILTIILVIVNCFLYYMIIFSNLKPWIDSRILMVNLIIGVVTCILVFILNIFNKPHMDTSSLDLIKNGWNPDPSQLNSTIEFNYVYKISFISDGNQTLSSHKNLSIFNIIWILGMSVFMAAYVISLFMFLYSKQIKLSPIFRKAQYA